MKKEKLVGRIHSIETMGTVDGPGIRFVVFMQGCILKCKYCHNRDTWDASKGTEYSVDDVIKRALRCKTYMNASKDGGITVSGGEPLLQVEFLTELFKILKKKKIHTAIDTAGSLPITDEIKELLKYTDLVLLDIKHIDEEKAINLTGRSNKNELDFARYLSDINKPVWIRQVLVPGYTDDKKDLKKLKYFIDTLNNVQNIEILPYHNMGKYKWINLGDEYELENVVPPSLKAVEKAKNILGIL